MKLFSVGFWIIFLTFLGSALSGIKPSAPELKDYYKDYIKILDNNCPNFDKPKKLSLSFKDLKFGELGLCNYYIFKREIFISKTYWENASLNERRQLVFHELTHCVLNIHHVNDPNHYMNPYLNLIPEKDLMDQLKIDIEVACNN